MMLITTATSDLIDQTRTAHPQRCETAHLQIATEAEQPIAATGYLRFKRVAEWTAALVLSVILAPFIAVLVVLVKCTSTGPAFYSQSRLGRGGRQYWIYKLRTMAHRCEAETGPAWSGIDDPRVTSFGRWLRDTHLDELPQLWNVLRGEMALVGPRPERPEIALRIQQALPDFNIRLLVRPGITGLAQIRMPADTDLDSVRRKLAHDLYYIRNLSLLLDARVLLATVLHVLSTASAALCRRVTKSFAPVVDDFRPIMNDDNLYLSSQIRVIHSQAA
jgi:lipopolysaccharide/colanic/teichoic acid biosynthesis glycosyltransferase